MRSWRIIAGLTALLIAGLGLGCDGFFVDPILTGIAVGPAATIQTGTTIQLTTVGTYNDGSQKKISSNVSWSSATPEVATVNQSGVVTGLGPGQSVITGAAETVSGSATVTVTLGVWRQLISPRKTALITSSTAAANNSLRLVRQMGNKSI